MHNAIELLYDDDSNGGRVTLASKKAQSTDFDESVFTAAAKWMHGRGEFTPDMLAEQPAVDVMQEIYRVLNTAISSEIKTEIPSELVGALSNNAFIFSGFKAYRSLDELGLSLTNKDGAVKPYKEFEADVQKVNAKYNRAYLAAEYDHAVAASQMAVKWHGFEQDADRYDLQYRTAGDDSVRLSHQVLNNITLPASDPFWSKYMPPNGWRCRCTTVQVRKGQYPASSPEEAIKLGDATTAQPKQQIFRFNPGKELKIFPPKHPYLPKGCGDCSRKNTLNLTLRDRGLPMCAACGIVAKECLKTQERTVKEWSKENISERGGINMSGKNFASGSVLVTRGSIKEVIGHTQNIAVINSMMGIKTNTLKYKYLGWAECSTDKNTGKRKHPEAEYFIYYSTKIGGKTYYVNVKAHKHANREVLYCIREKCNFKALKSGTPPNIDRYKKE